MQEQEQVQEIEVVLDSAVGPFVAYSPGTDPSDVDASIPRGYFVAWDNVIRTSTGYRAPLVMRDTDRVLLCRDNAGREFVCAVFADGTACAMEITGDSPREIVDAIADAIGDATTCEDWMPALVLSAQRARRWIDSVRATGDYVTFDASDSDDDISTAVAAFIAESEENQ